MFSVAGILAMLNAIGPVAARAPEFIKVFHQIKDTFKKPEDQATLQKGYEELMAENTGGHVRLQEMLRKAAQAE